MKKSLSLILLIIGISLRATPFAPRHSESKLPLCTQLVGISASLNATEKLLRTITVQGPANWWNTSTQLNALRLAPPLTGTTISYYDITGDGKPDVLRTVTANGTPIQWIDDDHNMKIGDLSGDQVNDCLMIDRNRDGLYGSYDDLIIDWTDTDSDGSADIQLVVENRKEGETNPGAGHYMYVIDIDRDNVFNYIDFNTFQLRCWLHNGLADFYTDYNGNSAFLKLHGTPERMADVSLNWENPFLFFDADNDGLTEMTVRLCDQGGESNFGRNPNGKMSWAAICVDLDNDNNPENPLDLDMTIHFHSENPAAYTHYRHVYQQLRGLPEADCYFLDPKWRQNTELIFPDNKECFSFIFGDGKWDRVWFSFDEDDDCKRWERVELYQPLDLYKVGKRNGGLDNNPQADAIGDRGEFDADNSGHGSLYVSPLDGKIHLYGAEWGAWRIDQRGEYYQNMGGLYDVYGPERQQALPERFPVVKYEDTDNNGFFDVVHFDWDGNQQFEEHVNLHELGIADTATIIPIAEMRCPDYEALFRRVATDTWQRAEQAQQLAHSYGIDLSWYSLYRHPKTLRQQYDYGYWLQLYLYHDLLDLARRTSNPELEQTLTRAYFSSNWNLVEAAK